MQLVRIRHNDHVRQSYDWCMINLKDNAWKMTSNWPASGMIFEFSDEHDAVWFSLNCIK